MTSPLATRVAAPAERPHSSPVRVSPRSAARHLVAWAGRPGPGIALGAMAAWLVTRLAIIAFAYSMLVFRASLDSRGNSTLGVSGFLAHWRGWDAAYYIDIAAKWYTAARPDFAAFFPLYPALIRVTIGLGVRPDLAPLLVSNCGTLVGFVGVGLLAAHEAGTREGAPANESVARGRAEVWPALRALAAYPLAFYLFEAYTEGVFLACAAWALYWMRRGRWYPAATATFLASLDRSTGLVLALPLLYEFGRQHGWGRALRGRDLPALAAGALAAPLGLATFSMLCLGVYGDPLAWMHAQTGWGHLTTAPWVGLWRVLRTFAHQPVGSYSELRQWVDVGPLLTAIALTVVAAARRWQPVAFTLYCAGVLLLVTATPVATFGQVRYDSAGRYMLAVVPLFLLIGRGMRRWPWLDLLATSGGLLLQAALLAFLLAGGWLI